MMSQQRFPFDIPNSAEPQPAHLAQLRQAVAGALAVAANWGDLQDVLARQGLAYHPSGGGLCLIRLSGGRVLARGAEVGPDYTALVRRFGTGFPNHPHAGIAATVLAARQNPGGLPRAASWP